MTVVTCGRTNLSDRAEAITRVLREQQGFCLDVGCGRTFDLDNELQHIRVYRCLECSRWLCQPCIVAHFEATTDAYRAPGPNTGPRQGSGGATCDLGQFSPSAKEASDAPAPGNPGQATRQGPAERDNHRHTRTADTTAPAPATATQDTREPS